MRHLENHIGGRIVPAQSGDRLKNRDPATGQQIGSIPRSGQADIDAAVAAAKKAWPAWRDVPLEKRCQVLEAIADGLEENLERLAIMETQDTGKPITTSSTIDIPRAVRNFRFFADFARTEELPSHKMESGINYTSRQSVGVVGLVTPWNLPLYLLSWKVAPALAMGNTIVAKPSELTPQTADALAPIAANAGLPPGVLNIVHGLGPEAGAPLVSHPDVRAVSFTGGTATGKAVAAAAAPSFKKLSLELGGKNPGIVFSDSDVERTVEGIVRAGFTNQGQVCLCSSRILVEATIFEDFVDRLTAAVSALTPGDPMHPDTRLGALVSAQHREKVERFVQQAREEGATIHCGGDRPALGEALDGGAFLNPAVITGVAQSSACVQEEIFGPVVTVQPFANEAEAVALANDVRYGLAATVWTSDAAKGRRVAESLQTGMVWVNDWLVRDLRVPFGGMKQSGVGREGGRYSLDFYSEVRNIYVANRPEP